MAKSWELQLISPVNTVKEYLTAGWARALPDLKRWMGPELVRAMIYGGYGIQGINSTPYYQFVSSPEGLSELGIEKSQPQKLLKAYEKAFKISLNNNTLLLQFGDVAVLKMMTPHPASGTGNLHVQSWMEWIIDGLQVSDRGFIPKSKLPRGFKKYIRIRTAPGGLMLPRSFAGSDGRWEFPPEFQNYEIDWLQQNLKAIEEAILEFMIIALTIRL